MFSKEMEALIEATLADGELTDQEKTALINRAEKEGVDLNELEIYIQSILQKRQQELEKKSREAHAQQEEADLESEKLRAKTLRVCPKCGAKIPHLANACPDCGFIIEKTELDEYLSFLKQLLIRCLDNLIYRWDHFDLDWNSFFDIPQEKYEQYSKFLSIRNCGANDAAKEVGNYHVEINYSAVKAEASLYESNEGIGNYLNKLRNKEYNLLIEECEKAIKGAKSTILTSSKDYGKINQYEDCISDAKKLIRQIKSDYSDLSMGEIKDMEETIKNIEKQFDVQQSSPEFQKAALKANKGCFGVIALLIISSSFLCFALL